MIKNWNSKFKLGFALALVLAMVITSLVLADNLENDVVSVPASITLTAGDALSDVDVEFYIQATGVGSDGDAGCNFDSSSEYLTFTINTPSGVSASPSSLTFKKCHDGAILNAQTVSFSANASAVEGYISFTETANNSGGTFNYANGVFYIYIVTPPPSDTTDPTINCTVPDQMIWYGSDVSVSCTASDSGSGLANPSDASFTLSTSVAAGTETASAAINSKEVCDVAGNCATAGPYTFKVDKKDPSYSCAAAPSGWSATDVSIACTASDDGSGLATPASFNLSTYVAAGTETDNASTGTAAVTDNVGNSVTAGPISGIKVDKKDPSYSCDAAPSGWSATDVSIACTASDGGSGLATPASFNLSTYVAAGTETDNASTGTATVTDNVGHSVTAGPISGIKVDKKAPTDIAFVGGGLVEGGTYYFGFVPAGPTGCTATDGGSGLASCGVSGYSTAVGPHTVIAEAKDNVNNTSTKELHYTVLAWRLSGFYQPVDMNNVLNTVKNGSTVPLKFEVFAGSTELTDTSMIESTFTRQVTCNAPDEDPIEVLATGGTSLRYDLTSGQFIFNWQTPKLPGKCYTLTMTTKDGSVLTALFKLK